MHTQQSSSRPSAGFARFDRSGSVVAIAKAFDSALADLAALYLKTKNLHWYLSEQYFRDHPTAIDAGDLQTLVTLETVGNRIQTLGGIALRCLDQIARPPAAEEMPAVPRELLHQFHEGTVALAACLHDLDAVLGGRSTGTPRPPLKVWMERADRHGHILVEAARRT
jgi:DNA-binding ferritin-like protein